MTGERCRFFRSKTMFVSAERVEGTDDEESAAAAYCWCNRTMTEIGQDDRLVGLRACSDPERRCHKVV
jgi:hypothetical protein